ncbi:13182_t:CDS:2, partial [Dentiscutata heterogama]
YELFELASCLGIKFLDKLEQIADYQATFRVLELIWIAVRVAIHLYIQNKQISINNIPTENNNLLKITITFGVRMKKSIKSEYLEYFKNIPLINSVSDLELGITLDLELEILEPTENSLIQSAELIELDGFETSDQEPDEFELLNQSRFHFRFGI